MPKYRLNKITNVDVDENEHKNVHENINTLPTEDNIKYTRYPPPAKRDPNLTNDVDLSKTPLTKTYTLTDYMDFGQYKGATIRAVIDHDPRYVGWLINEADRFWLDKEAYQFWRIRRAKRNPTRSRSHPHSPPSARLRAILEELTDSDEDCICDEELYCDCP